ncbi:Putative hydroxypyruvate isomerase YgbM [Thalassovita gelatinovora]|uniref:Putative hydroxypyruvate isomerase YgbM n=1 Tax=Thalassovita gelatinovora TaxID=53501 RepID=A0A0P1FBR3_THAGE|nr:TIM barrel protein [Thalassovita gelatinovora]QIZ80088.1 TIM barrel protein [Thalassovita gelatinovora]CUH65515.1 Putative hydroxypyruvate isomerase YgbM [Thalassovita gelatinovora]SER08394.1 hydroxypyruvate isomerase [Thalassovita gelatinovora]
MQFSANLGFLWADRSLPAAIRAAKRAGFDAVECHWPYDVANEDVIAALSETGLEMVALNTRPGDVAAGDFGLAALPGRGPQARAAIDEAVEYGAAINARHVHVMAGKATGAEAAQVFAENLRYACARAARHDITILIEPINPDDAPGYFLTRTDQAVALIRAVGAGNLKLMFDCYHVQRTEGDVAGRLKTLLPWIGHIQFAAVPDRGPPDHGEVDYRSVFTLLRDVGYDRPLGAEYRPAGDTGASLAWLDWAKGI